ncbi:MAG: YbaB/EbfC family nucleoid-associated protein [Firmicutes bacterium]|nr:YbaB/EbfC family nucleoid-associated protein [Bacillota bacterium]
MKARLPQGVGGGPGNMNAMIKQAQKMQQDMQALQAELDEREYTATSGGGMVEARVNGKHEVLGLKIDPQVIDPDDAEMLEDMVAAAVNAALAEAAQNAEQEMGAITGGMNIPGMF